MSCEISGCAAALQGLACTFITSSHPITSSAFRIVGLSQQQRPGNRWHWRSRLGGGCRRQQGQGQERCGSLQGCPPLGRAVRQLRSQGAVRLPQGKWRHPYSSGGLLQKSAGCWGVCPEWASGLLGLTRIWTALSPQVALQEAVLHVTMMQQSIVTSLHLVPSEDLAAGCRAGSTSKPCPSFFSELAWPCHAPRPQSH